MSTLGLILAGWFLLSIPVALILGQVLKRRSMQYPATALHVVKGDQR